MSEEYRLLKLKAYEPKLVEKDIYEFWTESGYFQPKIDINKSPFTIIMPPPNVTGELHMGHALTTSLEDLMTRWHRMKGDPTLLLPGTDHAGIATQVVVERMLAQNNLTRQELGREKFTEHVWDWVDKYGERIYEQLKSLGVSCDWTRKHFTLDEGPSNSVVTTFVNLYKEGFIYRGERIVNWCVRCSTALSDLEVKYVNQEGELYHIRYSLVDSDESVVIATTRPETMIGDTAVAINPNDERYLDLHDKFIELPIVGRKLPIITDDLVDPTYGTGVLKVTPGHDPHDFEIAQRHEIDVLNVMKPDGTMDEKTGDYFGLTVGEARTQILTDLERIQRLVKVEKISHSVGRCDRCNTIVEPMISKQWYMKMKPIAEPAIKAVESGQINIIPKRFEKVYFNWMNNIRDWCVSRQLWWGHRLPVWYCLDCGATLVEIKEPNVCATCNSKNLERDPDVLDTWFSSALWPHSTLGWPDKTEDLNYFYPTSVMETGHDILFFWVARMIMMGIRNTGEIPFKTIYLHGLVRDPQGIKMSKTKGNVMDPLELIETYGADALRFALTMGLAAGNDNRLNENKIQFGRNFANKLWNASRFVINNATDQKEYKSINPIDINHIHDKWILSLLNRLILDFDNHMEEFQFSEAQQEVYEYFWDRYCDWYLEMSKLRIRSGDVSCISTLILVLDRILRLLHPFMPFITEEIWQTLKKEIGGSEFNDDALIIASFPVGDKNSIDYDAESIIESVIDIIRAVRNLRAELHIPPNISLDIQIESELIDRISDQLVFIEQLANVNIGDNSLKANLEDDEVNQLVSIVLDESVVSVSIKDYIDIDSEIDRLNKELNNINERINSISKRLADSKFLNNAPSEIVDKETEKHRISKERSEKLSKLLSQLK
tara:strand:+ start:33315 stop:35981 length:2667 start_codon:yes stop_codon:yes gene_type:complete